MSLGRHAGKLGAGVILFGVLKVG